MAFFLAKQTPPTKKPCMSSYRTMLYPVTVLLSISTLSLACGTVFQVLTLKICLQALLGRVPCLLSGMALQLVLTSLLLSDAFVRALSMRHVISLVTF